MRISIPLLPMTPTCLPNVPNSQNKKAASNQYPMRLVGMSQRGIFVICAIAHTCVSFNMDTPKCLLMLLEHFLLHS